MKNNIDKKLSLPTEILIKIRQAERRGIVQIACPRWALLNGLLFHITYTAKVRFWRADFRSEEDASYLRTR